MNEISEARYGFWGAVCMLTAAVFFSAMSIVVKYLSEGTNLWQVSMSRFAIGAVIVWGIVRLLRKDLWGEHKGLLLIRGILGTGAAVGLFEAILTLPIGAALVLHFTFPIFAAIMSPWITGEPTSLREWFFIILAVIGTTVILWPEDASLGFNYYYLFALGSAVCGGAVTSLIRRLRASNSPMTLYFYLCLVGAATSLPMLLKQDAPMIPDTHISLGLILMAVLATIGQLAMNQGYKFLSAPKGGVLMMSEIIMGALAGILFFGEPMSAKFLVGACLIVFSAVFLTVQPRVPKNVVPALAK